MVGVGGRRQPEYCGVRLHGLAAYSRLPVGALVQSAAHSSGQAVTVERAGQDEQLGGDQSNSWPALLSIAPNQAPAMQPAVSRRVSS